MPPIDSLRVWLSYHLINADQINAFNGCCVEITVDSEPALGILFCREGGVSITTLCFANTKSTCPMLTHDLTSTDMDSLKRIDHKHLASAIAVNSRRPEEANAPETSKGKTSRLAFQAANLTH